ncbi:MAG: sensor histidine kinase, partial [Hyphomicrobiaceae bacterium]|nr:sensor histidine kinase [Hyphomicrobiaceae bacterium]
MLHGSHTPGRSASLINDYASLLGEAVLRHRTRTAEHAARIEAELASRVKSEFIANMSHELRTPLNTVIGFSKLISEQERRKLPDAEIVEYANLIRDAAGHLLAVINDILDISKIQSGKFTLEKRDVQLDEILTACLASFR